MCFFIYIEVIYLGKVVDFEYFLNYYLVILNISGDMF